MLIKWGKYHWQIAATISGYDWLSQAMIGYLKDKVTTTFPVEYSRALKSN